MRSLIRPAIVSLVMLTVITGIVYPLLVTVVAWAVFPNQASGSLLVENGKTYGSALMGQPFTDARYFWSRPSATSPYPYNGEASAGSNLAPSNPALAKAIRERIATLKAADPANNKPVPADLVTASGSGLDPHISPAAAEYQVARVARARKLDESMVRRLVAQYADGRDWGLLGEPRVNVLKVNFALDHPEWSKSQQLQPNTRFLRQRAFMPER
jgi:K+-transporting ATPase ATPase C chain